MGLFEFFNFFLVFQRLGDFVQTFQKMSFCAGIDVKQEFPFSLGLMSTKYVAEHRRRDPERAGRVMGLATLTGVGATALVSLALVFLAPMLAERAGSWIREACASAAA